MKQAWPLHSIGDVALVFDGPHATPKTVESGPIFLGISALQDGCINLAETRHVTDDDFAHWTRRVRPQVGDVVFSYETRLGQVAVIPPGLECCLGRRMGLIRFNPDKVLSKWFIYQYMSPDYQAFIDSKTIRGATVDRISIKEFPAFPVAVPDLNEQRRIVSILDEAFEAIATALANAEKNLQNAREIFDSALDAAISCPTGSYIETTLGAEIDLLAGYAFSSQGYTYAAEGIRLLRGDNIMQGYLRWEDAKYWPAQDAGAYARFALKQGDVVLAMDRPWVKAGLKRAQISANDLPCLQLQRTARLRPKRRMSVDFL